MSIFLVYSKISWSTNRISIFLGFSQKRVHFAQGKLSGVVVINSGPKNKEEDHYEQHYPRNR